jgi:hypothetical protein
MSERSVAQKLREQGLPGALVEPTAKIVAALSAVETADLRVRAAAVIISAIDQAAAATGRDSSETWAQARPGNIVVGDTVRVRSDAYDSTVGVAHNGRVGVVTAIRYGNIFMRYTDVGPTPLNLPRHKIQVLEKKVK